MNKIRNILLSILSIPMVLSNSVSHATTSIEVIHDGKKVEFDDGKLQEAKDLLNRVNEKFESTNVELRDVENTLEFYGIDIDKAATYKRVIEVLQSNYTLNCKSIEYISNYVETNFGTSEVDFVVANCENLEKVYNYITELRQLKKLEEKFNAVVPEEKESKKKEIEEKEQKIIKDYKWYLIPDNPDYVSNCANLISKIGVENGAKDILKSCNALYGVASVRDVLCNLKDMLRNNFGNNSNLCADTLLPKLNRAIELKGENARYNKALKHDLNYWYEDQWRWIKRFGNFISFADNSEIGKASRAIDNYIVEMKRALGNGTSSSNVGKYLFLGTVLIGGLVYYLYESVDGEVVFVPKKSAQNYEQDNEYDYDDDYDE